MSVTKYQKFEVVRMWRSEIQLAHYNPRKITDENRKELKKNIKGDAGLIETLVVNRTTGNLVSGHQRLSILDELEGYPVKVDDYQLDVAVVTMTEQQEKKQNLFMNARGAQGEYDAEAMARLMQEITIEDTGLTDADLALLGVNIPSVDAPAVDDRYFDTMFAKKAGKPDDQARNKEHVKAMKQQISEGAGQKVADTMLSYVVLNFPDYQQKKQFMERFGLDPFDTFTDGAAFSRMVERVYDDELEVDDLL